MTESEFVLGGHGNVHRRFTFSDGSSASGVITLHIPTEARNYYLITSPNLIEAKSLFNNRQYNELKKLCIPVNFSDIVKAEPV